jgi:endothelial-specific receptor tyrosine kinase
MENNNGPVTFYQIIVYFVGNEILQDFDQTLLKGYKQSEEDGTPYYIAAELELTHKRRFTVGDGLTYRGYYNAPLPMHRHFHCSIGVVSQLNNVTKVRYARTTHDQHVNSHPNVHIGFVEGD